MIRPCEAALISEISSNIKQYFWGFGLLQLVNEQKCIKRKVKFTVPIEQLHQTAGGVKLQLSYSATIVPPLHPSHHSFRPVSPSPFPPLPSTSVFIFCLPTPTWTNTHIHSTNTSAKLRIWARTLSCMPAGRCLHSHMTQKPGLRRRGISLNQTSYSQQPLPGPGSSGAQVTVRQDVDILFWGSALWPRLCTLCLLTIILIWITFTASHLISTTQIHISSPSFLYHFKITYLMWFILFISPKKKNIYMHLHVCPSCSRSICTLSSCLLPGKGFQTSFLATFGYVLAFVWFC